MDVYQFILTLLSLIESGQAGKLVHVSKYFDLGRVKVNITADVTVDVETSAPAANAAPYTEALMALTDITLGENAPIVLKWLINGENNQFTVATLTIGISRL